MPATSICVLVALLAPPPAQDPTAPGWVRVEFSDFDTASFVLTPPGPSRTVDTTFLRPRVLLDSGADAEVVLPLFGNVAITEGRMLEWLDDATLLARAPLDAPLVGDLVLPGHDPATPSRRIDLSIPAEALAPASRADVAALWLGRTRRLLGADLPGAAWFRYVHDRVEPLAAGSDLTERMGLAADAPAWERTRERRAEREEYETLGFLSGGRALAENLQLDRIPPPPDDAEATVPLADVQGLTVRPFDWGPLVADVDPELDPLADALPADQYALFAPSLAALDRALDELEGLGAPAVQFAELRARREDVRARYERQLCAPLDELDTTLGALAVRSVAITGGDPYLRMGSDLAVVIEARSVDAVLAFLRARAAAAAEAGGVELSSTTVEGRDGPVAVEAALSADRRVRVWTAALGDRVVVTNSLQQLERLAAVARGELEAQADSDEYRFFRARYVRAADDESAFLVVPDAAIRAWCGPRVRIASARRTRAQALLADRQAEFDLAGRADLPGTSPLRPTGALGTVRTVDGTVVSSRYGTRDFLTPIAELPLAAVTPREAELYDRWRRGYERNWSTYFDPVGARLSVTDAGTEVDLTVLPLIAGSDYRELIETVGAERLEGRDGDPDAPASIHFVSALDPEGEELTELGRDMAGTFDGFGPNALSWLGDWWSVHAEEGELLDMLLEADDLDEAWDTLEADLDLLPVVFQVGVRRPLALAGFLTALRGLAEGSAPGLVAWHTERTEDGRPFVRVASAMLTSDEVALYYATTPKALIVSFSREALVAALDRWNPPAREDGTRPEPPPDEGPTPWLGGSAAFELEPRALLYLGLLDGDDPRELAREACWSNLPALDAWHRLFPDEDPVAVHERLFGERLVCPGGGEYVWDAEWGRTGSTVFGHPDAPREAEPLPPALRAVERLRLGLTFEPELDGLRARAAVIRR